MMIPSRSSLLNDRLLFHHKSYFFRFLFVIAFLLWRVSPLSSQIGNQLCHALLIFFALCIWFQRTDRCESHLWLLKVLQLKLKVINKIVTESPVNLTSLDNIPILRTNPQIYFNSIEEQVIIHPREGGSGEGFWTLEWSHGGRGFWDFGGITWGGWGYRKYIKFYLEEES